MAEDRYAIKFVVDGAGEARAQIEGVGGSFKTLAAGSNAATLGFGGISASVASNAKSLASFVSGITLGTSALGFLGKTLLDVREDIKESEQDYARLGAVMTATGNQAGISGGEIAALAKEMAGTTLATEKGVRQAATSLATFQGISGAAFKDAIRLAQDLSAVFGGDLKGNTELIGRAMQDPINGLKGLERAVGGFTVAQREQIKVMIEAGDRTGAQAKIVEILRDKIGGAGAGEAQGAVGATDRMTKAWGNFAKALYEALPGGQAATSMVEGLTRALEAGENLAKGPSIDDRIAAQKERIAGLDGRTGAARDAAARANVEAARAAGLLSDMPPPLNQKRQKEIIADNDRRGERHSAASSLDAARADLARLEEEKSLRIGWSAESDALARDQAAQAAAQQAEGRRQAVSLIATKEGEGLRAQSGLSSLPENDRRIEETRLRAEMALREKLKSEGLYVLEQEKEIAAHGEIAASIERGKQQSKLKADELDRELDAARERLDLQNEEAKGAGELIKLEMSRQAAIDDVVKEMANEGRLVRMTTEEREKETTVLELQKKLGRDLTDEERKRVGEAVSALQKQKNAATDLWRGMGDAAKSYFDAVSDYGKLAGDFLVNSVFRPLERTISDFFMTGKMDFAKFTQAVKQGLADIGAKVVMAGLGGVAAGLAKSFGGTGGEAVANTIAGKSGGVFDTVSAWFKADGGYIQGPGGPRDDAIPAWLSNGEYVVNAAATAKHLPLLRAINDNAPLYADGGEVGPDGMPRFRFGGGAFKAVNNVIGKVEAIPFQLTGAGLNAAGLGNTGIADINAMTEAWARQGISADKVAIAALIASSIYTGGATLPLAMAAILAATKTGIAQEGLRATGLGDTGLMDIANGLSHAYTGKNAWRDAALAVAMAYLGSVGSQGVDNTLIAADEAKMAADLQSGAVSYEDAYMRLSELGNAQQQASYIEKVQMVAEGLTKGSITTDQLATSFANAFGSPAAANAASVGYFKNVVSEAMLAGLGFGGTGAGDGLFGGVLEKYGLAGKNVGDLRGMAALALGSLYGSTGDSFAGDMGKNYDAAYSDAVGVRRAAGLPGLATGGDVAAPGWARVGENGPEEVYFPGPARVYPNRGADFGPLVDELRALRRDMAQQKRVDVAGYEALTAALAAVEGRLARLEAPLRIAAARSVA